MILDIASAFEQGNKGLTIYKHEKGFMVSVKTELGGFLVGYGATPIEGLNDALGLSQPPEPYDPLGDLL